VDRAEDGRVEWIWNKVEGSRVEWTDSKEVLKDFKLRSC
jgi:hypothetical protein